MITSPVRLSVVSPIFFSYFCKGSSLKSEDTSFIVLISIIIQPLNLTMKWVIIAHILLNSYIKNKPFYFWINCLERGEKVILQFIITSQDILKMREGNSY